MKAQEMENMKRNQADDEIQFGFGDSWLGLVVAARSSKGLCAVLIGGSAGELELDLRSRFPNATLVGGDAEFNKIVTKVVKFVEDPSLGMDLPLDERGTDFQRRVWKTLRDIPAGSTASYTEVAKKIGRPKSVRAVASACAANPLAVVTPCHRVVRSDGGLSGYRWGVERKRKLLQRESAKCLSGVVAEA